MGSTSNLVLTDARRRGAILVEEFNCGLTKNVLDRFSVRSSLRVNLVVIVLLGVSGRLLRFTLRLWKNNSSRLPIHCADHFQTLIDVMTKVYLKNVSVRSLQSEGGPENFLLHSRVRTQEVGMRGGRGCSATTV